MHKVLINNDSEKRLPQSKIAKAAEMVLDGLLDDPCELSVSFVEVEAMAGLNTQYRSKEGPTDVLSFSLIAPEEFQNKRGRMTLRGNDTRLPAAPVADMPAPKGSELVYLGDVVICGSYVIAADKLLAGTSKKLFLDAVLWRLTHGILHLVGYDHETDKDLRRMRRKERLLMNKVLENEL